MIAIAIGLYLIGGLLTLVQAMRRTNTNQGGMSNLQDNERMAMQLISDAVPIHGLLRQSPHQQRRLGVSRDSRYPATSAGQGLYGNTPSWMRSRRAIRRTAPIKSSIAPATSAPRRRPRRPYLGESAFDHRRRHEVPDLPGMGQRRQYGGGSAHPDVTDDNRLRGDDRTGSASNWVDTYLKRGRDDERLLGGALGDDHPDVPESHVRTAGTNKYHGDLHAGHRRHE